MGKRREEVVRSGEGWGSGLRLTATRKGLELFGWYDSMVGIEPIYLTWDEVDALRTKVNDHG